MTFADGNLNLLLRCTTHFNVGNARLIEQALFDVVGEILFGLQADVAGNGNGHGKVLHVALIDHGRLYLPGEIVDLIDGVFDAAEGHIFIGIFGQFYGNSADVGGGRAADTVDTFEAFQLFF